MLNRKKLALGLLVLTAVVVPAWLYFRSQGRDVITARENLLAHLPADSSSVLYLDLQELRASPFLAQILAWAPHPPPEDEYTKFVQATGFDYERDLDRVGVSFSGTAENPKRMAVAEGHFDRKKIEAYSARFGTLKTANGKTIYAVTLNSPPRTAYFSFLRDDQVALCNDAARLPVAFRTVAASAGRIAFAATRHDARPIAVGVHRREAGRRGTAGGGRRGVQQRNHDPPA